MARRDISTMFAPAISAHDASSEIERLKQELESLKAEPRNGGGMQEIPTNQIRPLHLPHGMGQPRKYFDPVKLEQLKFSIEKHGQLEPILVRPTDGNFFESVSGERRWRCCKDLKKPTMLVRVKQLSDEEALEVALIATIYSEGVSAIEETDSVLSLLRLYLGINGDHADEDIKTLLIAVKNYRQSGYGDVSNEQAELVEATLGSFGFKLGSFVSNRLPLLKMSEQILESVRAGKVSPSSALLIDRLPNIFHSELLEFGQKATKTELRQRITDLKSGQTGSFNNSGIIEAAPIPIHDAIYARIRAIRRKKKQIQDPKIQQKLAAAQKILDEIFEEIV